MPSKKERRNLKAKGDLLKAQKRSLKKGTVCILCGEFIPKGYLLTHKELKHNEIKIMASPTANKKSSLWVSVVSGGLPSLGKR